MRSRKKPVVKARSNAFLGSSPANAAPIGVMLKTKIERGDPYSAPEIYDLDITLREIVRSNKALERIKSEGICSEQPEAGFEYILVRISIGYTRKGTGLGFEPYKLEQGQFASVSSDGKSEYGIPKAVCQPEPSIIGSVFSSGDVRDGWILLQTPKKEKKPLLVFKRENYEGVYGIWKAVWFQLY
jgi:hypothetical protein